ncbi:MAG: hypothetical protein HXX17_04220 [Geobacteraceae bacterium]|nr:hypothetical protein [Geobacteraceae bacterium]
MKKYIALIVVSTLIALSHQVVSAEGLPVSKYLEDPEHKNDILGFYLDAIFKGISLANERSKPPLFCFKESGQESAFSKIDARISRLKKEGHLSAEMTVDSIMMDILIEEYPCR